MQKINVTLLGFWLAAAGLAPSAAAEILSAEVDSVYEGHKLEFKFITTSPTSNRMRYKYKTQDGTATGSGYFADYEPASGCVYWAPHAYEAEAVVTVETKQDSTCEHDETVKIILNEPKFYNALVGWHGSCGGWLPCRFEATAKIKQHEQGCAAGQFGE